MVVVVVAVVRVIKIIQMMKMQMVGIPTDTECGGHTPEEPRIEMVIYRVGIVINRVRSFIVMINRRRLIGEHLRWLIVRYVDHFGVYRMDLDTISRNFDHLVFIAYQVSSGISLTSKFHYRREYVRLLDEHRLSELPCPIQIVTQQRDDFGIIEQRHHRLVPVFIRREGTVFCHGVQEAGG